LPPQASIHTARQWSSALARAWQPLPVAIALVAALELVAPHMLARPHVLAMPLMVGWIASLIRSNDAKRPADWRFRTVALGDALNLILEWRPQDFSHIEPYEVILLAAVAGALF
jgi:hypothetical protein